MLTAILSGTALAAALALPVPMPGTGSPSDLGASSSTREGRSHVRPRSDGWERRVVELTNRRRTAHDLAPLEASTCADGFAEPWTRHLARERVLVHQDLGPMLGCPSTTTAGENIAYGYDTPRALVSAWMHSPGHRANILNPGFDRIGVAAWVSIDGVTYATQDFIG